MRRISLGILASLFLSACATTKKPAVVKQVEIVEVAPENEVTMAVVEEISVDVESRPSPVGSTFDAPKSIQYNPRYAVSNNINEKYDFYWEKNDSERYSRQGVVDKSGNVLLPHLFTKGSGPSNNYELVLAISGSSYGLYNLNELRWSIPMMYHELQSLGNNLYSARLDNKWGVVDNNNTLIVPFQWKQIQRIGTLENYIMVSQEDISGVYSLVEKKLTMPVEYTSVRKLERQNYFLVKKGAKSNIIDISNRALFKTWYDEIRTSYMNPDYFIVRNNNRYGVVDNNEKVVVPLEYMEFSENNYSDGSYLARNKEGKYGFMLIDGRVTLPFKYDNLRKSSNSNIVSIQNGKCGLVQVNTGTPFEIVTCEFDNIREGIKTFVVEKDGKFGLLNQYGKQITPIDYNTLESFKENYYEDITVYIAQKGNNYHLLNEQGRVINESDFVEISPLYRRAQSYYNPRFTYLKAKDSKGLHGIVDKLGKTILKPQFEDIVSEDENIFIVKSKGKCGMYSLLTHTFIIDYEYDLIIKTTNSYIGFAGSKIDILSLRSGQVIKTSTVN